MLLRVLVWRSYMLSSSNTRRLLLLAMYPAISSLLGSNMRSVPMISLYCPVRRLFPTTSTGLSDSKFCDNAMFQYLNWCQRQSLLVYAAINRTPNKSIPSANSEKSTYLEGVDGTWLRKEMFHACRHFHNYMRGSRLWFLLLRLNSLSNHCAQL